jgi:geranylgeranyl diphosphate synthase type II
MDDDDLRRGRPTCHKQFDEATAILAGDALLTLAFETLAKEIEPPAVAARGCAALAEAAGACGMVGGQADDVWGERRGMLDEKSDGAGALAALESIHRRKTGAMIRVSLRLGAMVAGADDEKVDALVTYGDRIGLAFQIADDLLDVQSTAATMGKRVGKDAERGKLTYPGVLGVDPSRAYAERLIAQACQVLSPFGAKAEGLETVARYVLERNH